MSMSITEKTARFRQTNFGDEFVSEERTSSFSSSKVKTFKKLGDHDPLPNCKYFGRYKGVRLEDVPATQLDKWRDAQWIDDLYPNVRDYIDSHAAAIDSELKAQDKFEY